KRQTALLKQLAEDRGWKVNSPADAERRGGTITIEMPNSKEVCAELLKRDVVVDWRTNAGVRMAPHFYNTDEELHRAVAVVEEILSEMKVAR
ncbi:MAG: kynureninase, partial [Terriglobales bacterium]